MTEEEYTICYNTVKALMSYHTFYDEIGIDYEPYIQIPIQLELVHICLDMNYEPVFFATLAFPEEQHIQKYLINGVFPLEGFYGNGDTPWVIDFACRDPKRDLRSAFLAIKNMLTSDGYNKCFWIRSETGKFGWHTW